MVPYRYLHLYNHDLNWSKARPGNLKLNLSSFKTNFLYRIASRGQFHQRSTHRFYVRWWNWHQVGGLKYSSSTFTIQQGGLFLSHVIIFVMPIKAFVSLFWSSKAGVSTRHFAGRVRPANMIFVALEDVRISKYSKINSFKSYFYKNVHHGHL